MQAIEIKAEVNQFNEIKLKLPEEIKCKMVRVIILCEEKNDSPPPKKQRQFGQFEGKIKMDDDFDAPLPDSFWLGEDR